MNRNAITIGSKVFESKTKALSHYKEILNSYSAGETLRERDFESVFDLIYKGYDKTDISCYEEETGDTVKSIHVREHPEFRNTKCFVIEDGKGETQLFSYILSINGSLSDTKIFSRACRHAVDDRLREFKKDIFKNRPVRCAITNEIVEWEDCQIDHKAPLTFSVIVKSFIISNNIDISSVKYVTDISKEKFSNTDLAERFVRFHSAMAVLRILSTIQNAKLSGAARIKPSAKDGTLK